MDEEEIVVGKKISMEEFITKVAPYLGMLLQNWKKLLMINGIVAVLSAAALLLFFKNYYDSTVVILPGYGQADIAGSLGGLSSLAASVGINVGNAEPTDIYENLLNGEAILSPVIYKKYKTKKFDHPVNLIEYYEIDLDQTNQSDPVYLQERDKFEQMLKIFREKILKTDIDFTTHILTVTVRTNESILSSDVANTLVASLDNYVRTQRKSNAKEQRMYIEERTDQVEDSLRTAENDLKEFNQQNRVINLSPQLQLDQSRLMRTISILQAVYTQLITQMELVKLEEIKDTPIVNVEEDAGIPLKKAGPMRSIFFVIIMFLSLLVSSAWIVWREKIIFYYKTFLRNISVQLFA